MAAVVAHDLDEQVEAPGGDDDVARLVPAGDLVGDRLGAARRLDPDHRLRLEAEPERVRHAGDEQDPVVDKPRVPRADGRLGDTDARGDRAERRASVLLQRFDDAAVDRVERARPCDRAPHRLRHRHGAVLSDCCAFRQPTAVSMPKCAVLARAELHSEEPGDPRDRFRGRIATTAVLLGLLEREDRRADQRRRRPGGSARAERGRPCARRAGAASTRRRRRATSEASTRPASHDGPTPWPEYPSA